MLASSRPVAGQRAWPPYTGAQPIKSASPAEVAPGADITWTIVIANDVGDGEASVYLADDVPDPADGAPVAPFDIATVTAPAGAIKSYNGDSLTVSNVYVQPGATETITFRTRVAGTAADGAIICNQAFVRYLVTICGGGFPPLCEDQNFESRTWPPGAAAAGPTCVSVRRPITNAPDLRDSIKTVRDANGDGVATPGELLTWTITVPNVGTRQADDVVVTDVLDVRLTDIDAPTGIVDPGPPISITWSLGTIAAGSSATATFTARLPCGAPGGTICNQASVTATGVAALPTDDPSTSTANDETCLVVGAPDLAADETAAETSGDGLFAAGEDVRHAIVVRNDGTALALNVVVTQPIDPLVTVIDPGSGTLTPGPPETITWRLPFLYPLDAVPLVFTTRISPTAPGGSAVAHQASISADELAACGLAAVSDDPGTPPLDDPTVFTVEVPRFGAVTKTVTDADGDGIAEAGESLTWVIRVENGGRLPLAGIRIADSFDPAVMTISSPGGGTITGPGSLEWTLGQIPAGGSATRSFQTTRACLTTATTACNQAAVTATGVAPRDTDDPTTPALGDPTCLPIRSVDLGGSTKAAADASGDGVFAPGEEVVYTLTIGNTGTMDATDVVVADLLDASMAVTDPGTGTLTPGPPDSIEWSIATLNAGASVTLVFRARIDASAIAGTVIANQAILTSADGTACALATGTDDPSTGAAGDATAFTIGSNAPRIELLREIVDALRPAPSPAIASLLAARCAVRGSCPSCAVPAPRAGTVLLTGLPATGATSIDGDAISGRALIFYELSGTDSCLQVSRVDTDGDGTRDDIRIGW